MSLSYVARIRATYVLQAGVARRFWKNHFEESYAMKIRTSLVHLTALCFLTYGGLAQNEPPQAHIVSLTLDPQSVTVLHLHPGFVSSVRLPEEVSSVVLGDPAAFKGEHSEAEPRLVFFKPASPKPGKSNALITTRSGREVSLTLVSDGASAHSEAVDYVLEYQPQRSFLISAVYPTVLIGDTKSLGSERPASPSGSPKPDGDEHRPPSQQLASAPRLARQRAASSSRTDGRKRLGHDCRI